MKTLTIRLPEALFAEIERESKARGVSKSDVVRERLVAGQPANPLAHQLADYSGGN